MQLPTSIRSHWAGKNPSRNFQRSVTKHKALVWPGERMRSPQIQSLLHLESFKWGEDWWGNRLDEPFRLNNFLLWDFWGAPYSVSYRCTPIR